VRQKNPPCQIRRDAARKIFIEAKGEGRDKTAGEEKVSKKTVLIVEDEPSIIAVYLLLLETLDEEIIPLAAASYRKAREILAQESVDLIILDLMLQDAKATDVLGELRIEYPNTPIFLVTGNLEELDLEKAGQFGITQLFLKPIHVEPFGRAIENTLQQSP
jgi:response regulator of citrate/malate metabolism